jgi:hypothetical protein
VNEKKSAEQTTQKQIKTNEPLKIITSPVNQKYSFL